MTSENGLIVSFSPIDTTPKVNDLSDIEYRTRILQRFKITDKVAYTFFAHRK